MIVERVLLLFAIISKGQTINLGFKRKEVHLERINGTCETNPDALMYWNFSDPQTVNNKFHANHVFYVMQDIRTPPTLHVKIVKCPLQNASSICEDFHSFATGDYCKFINSNFWRQLVGTFKPRLKCPIRRGIYRSTDGYYDLTPFLLIPASHEYFWRFFIEITDQDTGKRIMCAVLRMDIETIN